MTITYINLHDGAIDLALSDPRISQAATAIVVQEGGLTNDKDDVGGITMDGISLRYAKGIGLDLNGDGQTDASDIMLVTKDDAIRLYVEDFFIVPKLSMLPACLWPFMFDFNVNSGPPRAIMTLQQTLNAARAASPDAQLSNSWAVLDVDGVLGGASQRAAATCLTMAGFPRLLDNLCDARQAFCDALVISRPADATFIHGWTNRINSFRQ
jgi:lysozyme family protein